MIKAIIDKIKYLQRRHIHKKRRKLFYNSPSSFARLELINRPELTKIIVGEKVGLYNNVTFRGRGTVEIGDNTLIGDNTIIFSCGTKESGGGIKFGNNVLIAANCAFYDSDHGIDRNELIKKQPLKLSPIIIEDDVWIGTGAIILRGSVIKKGAVIGAGSVVKGTIPEYAVAVGVPAKVIKYRS